MQLYRICKFATEKTCSRYCCPRSRLTNILTIDGQTHCTVEIFGGGVLAFGGVKGSALSLLIKVLSGVLTKIENRADDDPASMLKPQCRLQLFI